MDENKPKRKRRSERLMLSWDGRKMRAHRHQVGGDNAAYDVENSVNVLWLVLDFLLTCGWRAGWMAFGRALRAVRREWKQ